MAIRTVARTELAIEDQELCWQVAQAKDTSMDGVFFVAVRTTGIYCRPSCRSRTPKRQNVTFFASADECEAAGYRACKRCKPRELTSDSRPEMVQQACDYLETEEADVSLSPVARRLGVKAEYLRRLFKRTLGVPPREYAASLRASRLKDGLRGGASVTQAMYDAGYPSSNRLYESVDAQLGMTPATYRRGGRGMAISYQIAECTLGKLLVAATERGICAVRLGDTDVQLEASLRHEFPLALMSRRNDPASEWVQEVVRFLDGHQVRLDLPMDIQGTAFQIRVWRALQAIAYGRTKSYSDVAKDIGMPKAVRAVARACATNPVPLIIPCHRVIRSNGELGGYGQGVERKVALLEMEAEHRQEAEAAAG
jgi:AraC family transcriptional regulator, regulatory protein of adaptative response / methylated-DNA-[protein]-cysteine methyltransferase